MRIAQIAPLAERCPPKLYGGTERIVSYLTEALVSLGHDVTLFASGDSVTSARLVPCSRVALRLDSRVRDPLPHQLLQLENVMHRADEFDVLHFHIDLIHYPLIRDIADRTITTLHGRLDLPDLWPFYDTFPHYPLVSISASQRLPMPPVNWRGTVYHGLPATMLRAPPHPRGDYLAFLGRISPEKRPDRAIDIAVRTGLPLKIAAKVDRVDEAYWHGTIAPMVAAHPNVEYVGEIGDANKGEFLGNARALLFPIDWPEPFGLVLIEAMACGTPVVAFPAGSVPEIVEHGVTGYIVETIADAVGAVESINALSRANIRAAFDARFTAGRMARDYVSLYNALPGVGGVPPVPDKLETSEMRFAA